MAVSTPVATRHAGDPKHSRPRLKYAGRVVNARTPPCTVEGQPSNRRSSASPMSPYLKRVSDGSGTDRYFCDIALN
jgi:hypothetical protein